MQLFYTFQSSSSLYFVMEYVPNGDLLQIIKTRVISPEAAKFYTCEILAALDYLHGKGFLHRDVKPENILISSDYHIKLCDFGSAKILSKDNVENNNSSDPNPAKISKSSSFVGTAEYCPPELLNERAASAASDLWAVGCILFYLCAKRLPFKGANDYQTFQRILGLRFSYPDASSDGDTKEPEFPADARAVVDRLLVLDPAARASVAELKRMPYFTHIASTEWDSLHLRTAPELPTADGADADAIRFSEDELALWYARSAAAAKGEDFVLPEAGKADLPASGSQNNAVKSNTDDFDDSTSSIQYPYETESGEGNGEFNSLDSAQIAAILTVDSSQQREDALAVQRSSVLAPLLGDNELIVMVGSVARRKGVFSSKLGLMLTDSPRLIFFDLEKYTLKKDLTSEAVSAEVTDTKSFTVKTHGKLYRLKGLEQTAGQWVEAVNKTFNKKA
ncbi:3-phosphoinositide dependent protein kinase-1 [Entophlyctis sp. JEL0112]|nr:3-phosphoinositide dependent protein kinase-1 [Entophlyctis sp. JEL0112]